MDRLNLVEAALGDVLKSSGLDSLIYTDVGGTSLNISRDGNPCIEVGLEPDYTVAYISLYNKIFPHKCYEFRGKDICVMIQFLISYLNG